MATPDNVIEGGNDTPKKTTNLPNDSIVFREENNQSRQEGERKEQLLEDQQQKPKQQPHLKRCRAGVPVLLARMTKGINNKKQETSSQTPINVLDVCDPDRPLPPWFAEIENVKDWTTQTQLMEYNDADHNAYFRRRPKRTLNEMDKRKQFHESEEKCCGVKRYNNGVGDIRTSFNIASNSAVANYFLQKNPKPITTMSTVSGIEDRRDDERRANERRRRIVFAPPTDKDDYGPNTLAEGKRWY